MNTVNISLAKSDSQVYEIASLADEIWHEHYGKILCTEQIDYMVDKFQSPSAITNDIRQGGYIYYLARHGETPAGYCAFRPEEHEKAVFVSKIYVKKEFRGKGLATRFLDNVLTVAEQLNCQKLWLTVNKENTGSIAAYEKLGFVIEDAMVTDIGSGFVMDDYKMSRPCIVRAD